MATLRDYFETDFRRDFVASNEYRFGLPPDDREIAVLVELHLDFDSNAEFVSCYLPSVPDPAAQIVGVCEQLDRLRAMKSGRGIHAGRDGELRVAADDLVFAGRVFAYSETDLADEDVKALAGLLRERGLMLRFRGPRYARARDRFDRPLAFISYDSGDRQAVAAPLAQALAAVRCRAWFDEWQMRAGDPIEGMLLRGLEQCERCIVILSRRYLENQRWARREFDTIMAREEREGRSLVIPLRVGVTEQEIAAFSPGLAGRKAVDWDPGRVPDIASQLSLTLLDVGRESPGTIRR